MKYNKINITYTQLQFLSIYSQVGIILISNIFWIGTYANDFDLKYINCLLNLRVKILST